MERPNERNSKGVIQLSANVWFEEVDTALVQEILNTVMFKDDITGELVSLGEEQVVVRKPEEEFFSEVFPCVSIYNSNYSFDKIRYNPHAVVVDKDLINHVVVMEETAKHNVLQYQIDFWAKYQDDMNTMTRTWLMKHFRQFNLSVIDDGGVERSCNCLVKQQPTKSDLISGGERLFHTIISCEIWVELDDETRYNVSMVTERDFEAKSKEEKEE